MMNTEKSSGFGIVDYCVFGGFLIFTGIIGLIMSYIGNKSPEEFLMGNRSFKPLPVAMSLLTSYVSAISLLAYSGEMYANGTQFSMILIGITLAIVFSFYLLLPMLYPLKLISVNEYIELRFRSKRLCFLISLLCVVKNLVICGICLYAPAIVLAPFTKLSIINNILLLGITCTLYSSFGGVRAVIWTDVFQLSVMLVGLISITTVGVIQNGGIIETLYKASEGGRIQFFDMNPSPFARHTFWNTVAFGFFNSVHSYSSEQVNIQRICAVKTIEKARRVLSYNIFGMILILSLIFTSGVVVYATYAGCDPMALGIISKKEEIIPYFVMDKLSFIPGFPGLFVATIIGGALSSVSSWINGCVAMIWRDFCLRFNHFKTASSTYATLVSKIISLVTGSAAIGFAILSTYAGSLLEFTFTIFGVLSSPILGIFMIGYFLPRTNTKGVWAGFILSMVLTIWIALGGMFYKTNSMMLPVSADECDLSNFTSVNTTTIEEFISLTNISMENTSSDTSFFVSLYQISYTLYAVIGALLCILIAVIVSFITGNKSIEETSPKFISPCVRKFYYNEENLSIFLENEKKTNSYNINVKENNIENSLEKLETSEDI